MENKSTRYIEVLWVDDEVQLHVPYKNLAKLNGINLVPFECWADAEKELLNDYNRWEAIILDGKCKLTKHDTANSVSFLSQVLADIARHASEKGRTVPWFILSAGGSECGPLNDLINKERMQWDAGWTEKTHKKYYSKATDRGELFNRVKLIASISDEVRIRTSLHADVFRAINSLEGIDKQAAQEDLTNILAALHFREKHKDFKPLYFYTRLRQILEHLFRAAIHAGLIPDKCQEKGKINLNQCSLYLAGKPAEIAQVRYGSKNDRLATPIIENGIKNILELGNIHSHTVDITDAEKEIIEDLFRTGKSHYVLFGLCMILCDIILWLKETIEKYEHNKDDFKTCTYLNPAQYEGKEVILQLDDKNNVFYGDCSVLCNKHLCESLKNKKVILKNVVINKSDKCDYLYFAKEFIEPEN